MTSPGPKCGILILNADDWGRDTHNTDSILACYDAGALSSVSAMVFMADSERAAAMARECDIEAGLHLNFTEPFSGASVPPRLLEQQARLSRHLRRHRLAPMLFHPGLRHAFRFVVDAQLEEFRRLYGRAPERIDGHHHMHLCANVIWQRLLPAGTLVRRNFSFLSGEKGRLNIMYRRLVDSLLARRHRMTDYFFSIEPLEPRERLQAVFSLANRFSVEVETHPVVPGEFTFLATGEVKRWLDGTLIGRPSALR